MSCALAAASVQAGDRQILAAAIGVNPASLPEKSQSDADVAKGHLSRKEFDQALEVAGRMIRDNPQQALGYQIQAAAYIGKKDLDGARKTYESLLKAKPDDASTTLGLAQLDVWQKDFPAARRRYEAILAKDPRSVPAMVGMANLESASGNAKQSGPWLEKAKAAQPDALAPRLDLALYYFRNNNNAKALAELRDADRIAPANPQVLNLLAQIQAADGQTLEAIATFKKLVSVRPNSPLAHYGLALLQIKNQNLPEAADSLRKAIELRPNYPEAVNALAGLEMRAGRPGEAIKLARALQKAAPKSPAGLTLEGDLLMQQKQYADAVKAYEGAIAVRSTGVLAVKLHTAQVQDGHAKEADARLQRWLSEHPDDAGAWQYLAESNLKAGQNKLAIEQYEKVLKLAPKNLAALNNLAVLYQREHDPRAVTYAEQAYRLVPDSPSIADTLGWILVDQGNTARGLELIQRAFVRAPNNVEIHYHLAVALAKSGDKAQARKELETLLGQNREFSQRADAERLLKQL
jgi:putative PEP-CTERM system TPR-repeat lipoprotein